MIFRKSTVAFYSNPNFPAFLSSPHPCHCITSLSCSRSTRPPPYRERSGVLPPRRCYATVRDEPKKSETSSDEHVWPTVPHPTPYDIFDQKRSAPYSKAKFYELVKIYHPDRHHHHHHHASVRPLSHTDRLERYRLVVLANQILSDPVKRRAYDLYGSGWGGSRSMENLYRTADRSWRNMPGNASMNATWEDWERWYNERDGKKEQQNPVFMSNQLFASILCMFVVIGSVGQARRASTNTANLVEMREKSHAAISEGMRKRQSEQASLGREGRVEDFLRRRNGWAVAEATTPTVSREK